MRHYLDYIEETIKTQGWKKAVSDYPDNITYTYEELGKEVMRMGMWLRERGIAEGDKVAICARNSSRWVTAYLGIVAMRGVVVSILPDFTAESIANLVKHSDAKLLLAGPNVLKRLEGTEIKGVRVEDLEFLRLADYEPGEVHFEKGGMDELALINYTSGTTENPKGVMISNKALSSNVRFALDVYKREEGDQMLSILPMAHIFGLLLDLLYQLAGGVHVVYMKTPPSPTLFMRALAEIKPYMIPTVPLVIDKIVKLLGYPKDRDLLMKILGGRVRYIVVGGAAISSKTEQCLMDLGLPYSSGYGMTECSPLISYSLHENFKIRSVGRAVDRMQVKVASPDPERVPGEILVRGDNTFMGYYKNPERTKLTKTEDGWVKTGDLGIIDKDGYIFLKGRCKNMILGPSGQNIYPEEIEEKINQIDGVMESVVVERDGKIIAMVYPNFDVLNPNAAQELRSRVNRDLPAYSQIAKVEFMEKEFAKTPKKSIKRYLYK